MTVLDTGSQGAKRQSFRKGSPRETLRRLIERKPRASAAQIHEEFSEAVLADADQLEAIIEYWFANNYRSLTQVPVAPHVPRPDKVRGLAEGIKVAATRMVLLDAIMPNGKLLRDCTGKDCAKAGGWLTKISRAIKPTDIVGKVMSEVDVRKFFKVA